MGSFCDRDATRKHTRVSIRNECQTELAKKEALRTKLNAAPICWSEYVMWARNTMNGSMGRGEGERGRAYLALFGGEHAETSKRGREDAGIR